MTNPATLNCQTQLWPEATFVHNYIPALHIRLTVNTSLYDHLSLVLVCTIILMQNNVVFNNVDCWPHPQAPPTFCVTVTNKVML